MRDQEGADQGQRRDREQLAHETRILRRNRPRARSAFARSHGEEYRPRPCAEDFIPGDAPDSRKTQGVNTRRCTRTCPAALSIAQYAPGGAPGTPAEARHTARCGPGSSWASTSRAMRRPVASYTSSVTGPATAREKSRVTSPCAGVGRAGASVSVFGGGGALAS